MHVQNGLTQGIHVQFEPTLADGLADLVDLLHVHIRGGGQLDPRLIDGLGGGADPGFPWLAWG